MKQPTIRVRALIPYGDTLFLVKHPGRDFFALPGGKMENNESSKDALIREIHEELGVIPVIHGLFCVHEFVYPLGDRSFELFFVVRNGHDFVGSLLGTHAHELEEWGFYRPHTLELRPSFLQDMLPDIFAFDGMCKAHVIVDDTK